MTSDRPKRITIIGAGITGLSCAFRLQELAREQNLPLELKILEASDRTGGILWTTHRDGFLLEEGPDNFITNKPWGLDLINRLGLTDQLLQTNDEHRRAMVVRKGKLTPIPEGFELMAPRNPWALLRTPIFSLRGKLRMLWERFVPARKVNPDESLESFIVRRFGREALDNLVQALVGGIYTADPKTLSLRATLPRFLDMETEHGSLIKALRKQQKQQRADDSENIAGARYSLFITLKNGMQTLPDTLISKLPKDCVRCGTTVSTVTRHDANASAPTTPTWQVTTATGESFESDGVIVTAPAHRAAPLFQSIDTDIASALARIDYAASAVAHFAYRRDDVPHALDAFGFVVPAKENRSIIAGTFSSTKYLGRAPAGHVLIRTFMGGALSSNAIPHDDDVLFTNVKKELRDLLGITTPPLFTTLRRCGPCMPQYTVGHLDRIAALRQAMTKHPGLEIAGSAYEGVGIPDCIHNGEHAAERLLDPIIAG